MFKFKVISTLKPKQPQSTELVIITANFVRFDYLAQFSWDLIDTAH